LTSAPSSCYFSAIDGSIVVEYKPKSVWTRIKASIWFFMAVALTTTFRALLTLAGKSFFIKLLVGVNAFARSH